MRAQGSGSGSNREKGRYEERRESAKKSARRQTAGYMEERGDEGEGERKRECGGTTSTVATRKFDFQIGVARANGPRREGSESYVRSLRDHVGCVGRREECVTREWRRARGAGDSTR